MKVAELEGAELDYWVAKAEGVPREVLDAGHTLKVFHPSTDWQDGGPIIERERITLAAPEADEQQIWFASKLTGDSMGTQEAGPTPLIAAMRCYTASVFGDEVPDDAPIE